MSRDRLLLIGRWCWLLQPLALVVELVAVAKVQAPYSLIDNTISDLGATTCTTIPYGNVAVPVCSPAHAVVNASGVVVGIALAAGAVLLRPVTPGRRLRDAAVAAWVVSGAGSVGSAFAPLDQHLVAHVVISTFGILAAPLALTLTACAFVRDGRRAWIAGVVAGVALTLVAAFLLVRIDPELGGLLERLVLWPISLAVPLAALSVKSVTR